MRTKEQLNQEYQLIVFNLGVLRVQRADAERAEQKMQQDIVALREELKQIEAVEAEIAKAAAAAAADPTTNQVAVPAASPAAPENDNA